MRQIGCIGENRGTGLMSWRPRIGHDFQYLESPFLSRPHRVAKGNRVGSGDLSAYRKTAHARDLWSNRPDEAFSGIDRGEHRGRTRPRRHAGLHPVSINCERILKRVGNLLGSDCGPEVRWPGGVSPLYRAWCRGWQDAHEIASVARKEAGHALPLNPRSSILNPQSSILNPDSSILNPDSYPATASRITLSRCM